MDWSNAPPPWATTSRAARPATASYIWRYASRAPEEPRDTETTTATPIPTLSKVNTLRAGRRWTGWILPGTASVVAIAALALVATMQPAPAHDPVAAAVVGQPMRGLQVGPGGTQPVAAGAPGQGASRIDVYRAAQWQDEFEGRPVTKQVYRVVLPWGGEVAVQAAIFDARGLDLDEGDRVHAGGYDLRVVASSTGRYAVSYRAPDGVGYVFIAPELSVHDLADLVGGYLIDQVGAQLGPR